MMTEREIREARVALDVELAKKQLEIQERQQRLELDKLALYKWYDEQYNTLTARLIAVLDGEAAATSFREIVKGNRNG